MKWIPGGIVEFLMCCCLFTRLHMLRVKISSISKFQYTFQQKDYSPHGTDWKPILLVIVFNIMIIYIFILLEKTLICTILTELVTTAHTVTHHYAKEVIIKYIPSKITYIQLKEYIFQLLK